MRTNFSTLLGVVFTLIILVFSSGSISAQTAGTSAARITQAVVENNRVTLKGNTHPLASVKNDRGAAPDSLPMERMLLVLKRSAGQESALKAVMEGQQSKSSPNFHQWLTPEQFGQQFGVSDNDIQTVTAWLQTHGFQVNRVAAGKMLIEFTGTAGQVHEAFQTQIHKYVVNGEEHWANASDPSIPAALAPVIAGVNTMHNFGKKAMIRKGSVVRTVASSGTATPLVTTGCPQGFATGLSSNANCFGVGPGDLSAIYNIPSTVGGAAAGTGQTIAVVGDSNICTGSPLPAGCTADDILNFRTLFGLPTGGATNAPTIILDGPDPGLNGDEIEGDLDVEYSGAVAPNAQILFVIAENTASANGVDLAAEHVVDFNLASVLNESFGECEFSLGNAGNLFFQGLWQQAAAQGITVTISTGDTGSASCDFGVSVAQGGLTVSGIASTPFNVAAGGTDFDFTATGYPQSFWNTTSGVNFRTAKGYIPETTWNDSCAQSGLTGCNSLTINSSAPPLGLSGGAGGQSNCVAQDLFGNCTQSYAKPTWQAGSGVPNDIVRDLPDIALFSAVGVLSGSFYVVCESDLGGDCVNGGSGFSFIPVGGTSASAPIFTGIMALVNQNMVANSQSGRQGNANFVLYPMSAAQTQSALACNSSSGPAANCVFNDVVKGNNSQPCVAGSFECSVTTANSTAVGVLVTENDSPFTNGSQGFSATSGYDLGTGLGSVNVTNLVNGWPAAVGSFTPTTTTLTMSPLSTCPPSTPAGITSCVSVVHGATVTSNITVTGGTTANPITATVNRQDNASLIGTCQTAIPNCFVGGSNTAGVDRFDAVTGNADIYPLTNGSVTGTTKELVGGTYNVTAHYAGDGIHGASDSLTPIQVTVSPEASTTRVVVLGSTSAATTAAYGSQLAVRTDIVGTASRLETATGQVTLNDTFSGATPILLNLNSDGHVELQTPSISFPGNNAAVTTIPALAVGSHNFTAVYAGDPSYSPSTSANVSFTITQSPTFSAITTAPTTVAANANFTLAATISSGSFGNAPTGTVSFFAGTTLLGSASVVGEPAGNFPAGAVATLTTAKISAASSITAQYVGDTNYTTSTSPAVTVTTTGGSGTFTLAGTAATIATPGQTGTSTITATGTGGFTGSVALTCSVTPSNLTDPPTCTVGGPISLSAGTTTGTATLSIFTTAASGIPFAPTNHVNPNARWMVGAGAAATFLTVLLLSVAPIRKRRPAVALASLFVFVGLMVGGCGSSGGNVIHNPGTTATTYTVTVTGTSGSTTASTTVNVTVQ